MTSPTQSPAARTIVTNNRSHMEVRLPVGPTGFQTFVSELGRSKLSNKADLLVRARADQANVRHTHRSRQTCVVIFFIFYKTNFREGGRETGRIERKNVCYPEAVGTHTQILHYKVVSVCVCGRVACMCVHLCVCSTVVNTNLYV